MGGKKRNIVDFDFIIIFIVIIFLILFVLSLGNINLNNVDRVPNDLKDNKEEAKRKHKRLEEYLSKQIKLKKKLDIRFKRIYFGVRLGLVLIWFGLISFLFHINLINDFIGFLNYSELSILIIITVNFIIFGTVTDLKNFIDFIKTKIENLVYGKYINLGEKIEIKVVELKVLEKEIN